MSDDHIKVTCVGDDRITLTHAGESKEVMRITSEGIYVADGVSVDEAAQVVLDALSGEIRRLVSVARAVLHEQLAECERELRLERQRRWDGNADNSRELATVTAERDELAAAATALIESVRITDRDVAWDGLKAALAKLGAGKTGEVGQDYKEKANLYMEMMDAAAKDADKAYALLRWAATEMRYAGWDKRVSDNQGRADVYEAIEEAVG